MSNYTCKDTICNDPNWYWVRTQIGPNNIIYRALVWKTRSWSQDSSFLWCSYIIKSCSPYESFFWRRVGRLWFLAIFPSPLLGALTFTLYSPSWLILALHLLVGQVPTSVPVPSAVPPYFLLVAMIEVTLSRRLFPLTWSERWRVHLMRRGRIYPEPVLHRTPTWVPFYSLLL